MRTTLLISLLLLGITAQAAQLKALPDLQSPSPNEAGRLLEIEKIGLEWWLKNRGLAAEESLKVAGYFSVARPIEEFASRGDRVWEVRVIHLHTGAPSGILWINDRSGKVIGLGVAAKKKSERDARR